MKEERIKIGKIVNTFGIKGELKVYPYVDYIDELSKILQEKKSAYMQKQQEELLK